MSLLEYNIMKARHGRYADTAENRRLHRVGQEYGHAAKEDPEAAKKSGKGNEAKEEKRTFDTARKELSAVLSHKDEFIQKYGEDEYNKRVGALVVEAQKLRGIDNSAAADKDFDKMKQPEKPKKSPLSKRDQRISRLALYKEKLKKVQDKMNQEGESEESKKMGEALEAKWKAKIEKLEAKVNRGKKKEETSSEALANDIKEYTTKTSWLPREGTAIHFSDVVNSKGEKGELRIDLSGDSWEDGYDIKFGENFTAHAKDQAEAYTILEEFKAKDMPDVEVVEKKTKEPEKKEAEPEGKRLSSTDVKPNMAPKELKDSIKKELDDLMGQEGMHNDSPKWREGAYEIYKKYQEAYPKGKGLKNADKFVEWHGSYMDSRQAMKMEAYINARDSGASHEEAEKAAFDKLKRFSMGYEDNRLLEAVNPRYAGDGSWKHSDIHAENPSISKEFEVDGKKGNVEISLEYTKGKYGYRPEYKIKTSFDGALGEKISSVDTQIGPRSMIYYIEDIVNGKK